MLASHQTMMYEAKTTFFISLSLICFSIYQSTNPKIKLQMYCQDYTIKYTHYCVMGTSSILEDTARGKWGVFLTATVIGEDKSAGVLALAFLGSFVNVSVSLSFLKQNDTPNIFLLIIKSNCFYISIIHYMITLLWYLNLKF